MKLSLILLTVLVLGLANDTDAWFFRFRRVFRWVGRNFRTIKDVGCPLLCPKVCQKTVCKLACGLGCGRGKREAVKNSEGHVAPLPNMFSSYDFDDDGVISKDELATAINENITDSTFVVAFRYTDKDGNGFLSKKEFYNGPFVLEMDVNEQDDTYCKYLFGIDEDLEELLTNGEEGLGDVSGIDDNSNSTKLVSTASEPETQKKDKVL
ncbi:hypothetical protein LOTGIDRAFT_230493 [Lottia gigantea]|uniref:EF-hand domain-containing protein n=1 Tax=Lottia gigantea TaxID=225164 RepID=V4CLA8_LOTGI|nr:hypothetical protein LOTGIDRAFT_230493 [Lottia gigantea]ESP03070.1 hypothetical protein LOTGIDRAFT_230493 [Lottia gigantea]